MIEKLRGLRSYAVVWWMLLSLGLVGQLSGAVMYAPAGRKNRFMEPDLAESVATPAAWIALAAFALILFMPIPKTAAQNGAGTLAILTGIMSLLLLGYRLVVGTSDDRGFEPAQLVPALPLLWAAIAVLAVLAVRLELARRSQTTRRRAR